MSHGQTMSNQLANMPNSNLITTTAATSPNPISGGGVHFGVPVAIPVPPVAHAAAVHAHNCQRQDFRNRRSSSEPVHNAIVALANAEDTVQASSSKNSSGFIDCLQNISPIKVRLLLHKTHNTTQHFHLDKQKTIETLFFCFL